MKNILSGTITATIFGCIAFAAYGETQLRAEEEYLLEYQEQKYCLAMNIYHEARSESYLGQKAVGFVTINRVHSDRYPDTICDVVYQARLDAHGNPRRNQCQFSWYCDGKSDITHNQEEWDNAKNVADTVMQRYWDIEDVTEGATMYHASYVDPYWTDSFTQTVRIDTHIFYK